ncbi:hypothetical protein JST97_10405 [bacterium]|nr:hypothetical protein [bacterium]
MKIQSTPPVSGQTRARPQTPVEPDQFVAGGGPVLLRPNLLRQQRDQLLASFVASAPGLAPASAVEQTALCQSLDRVDTGVLRLLSKAGVGFLVLHEGDDLAQSQVLRRQSLNQWKAQLAACQQAGDQLHSQRQQAGDFSVQRLNLPVQLFQPRSDSPLGPRLTTLEAVALHHGARSPEEKQLFYQLVEELNGPRLEQARQENQAKLDQHGLQRDPAHVPIDPLKHTLLFPDLYFCGPERMLLDEHDQTTLETWHNGGSKVSFDSRQGDEWNGQYLYLGEQKRILVRDRALAGKTPVHELGHALDMHLEKQDPGFYSQFHSELARAYNRARSSSRAVSNYALANLREYFAEGFAHYYQDLDRLKKADPELCALIEAACQRACQLEGLDMKSGRQVREQLEQLPVQVGQSLRQLAEDPQAARAQLTEVVRTLKGPRPSARTALESSMLAVSYGLMAGAADAVLRYSLGQLQGPSDGADLKLEQAASSADDQQAFQLAYQVSSQILP